jgi:hypothetical protein
MVMNGSRLDTDAMRYVHKAKGVEALFPDKLVGNVNDGFSRCH